MIQEKLGALGGVWDGVSDEFGLTFSKPLKGKPSLKVKVKVYLKVNLL